MTGRSPGQHVRHAYSARAAAPAPGSSAIDGLQPGYARAMRGYCFCYLPLSGLLISGALVLVSLPEGVSVGAGASGDFPPALRSTPTGPAPRGICRSLLALRCSV